MEHFPKLLSEEESRNMVERIRAHFEKYGFGFFAVELKETHEFIGFVGIQNVPFESHFTPAIEIGWRLDSKHFGQGYAPEAAKKVLEFAFEDLGLKEVVAFTIPANKNSRRVMEKIGMTYEEKDNFEHPKVAKNDRCSLHVLYRIKNPT